MRGLEKEESPYSLNDLWCITAHQTGEALGVTHLIVILAGIILSFDYVPI
jgi:hypothetical protein